MSQTGVSPAYLDRRGIVFKGDSCTIMSSLVSRSIDLILTDPPYGIDYNSRQHRKLKNDKPRKAMTLFRAFVIEARRVLKPGGCCLVFCFGGGRKPTFPEWIHLMQEQFEYKATLVWDKLVAGRGAHYRNQYDLILVGKRRGAACVWNGEHQTSNVLRATRCRPDLSDHPTPKPQDLLSRLIELHSNKGDIVLDPFAGHGSTLTASAKLGRRFIGIELDGRFSRAIVRNLKNAKP